MPQDGSEPSRRLALHRSLVIFLLLLPHLRLARNEGLPFPLPASAAVCPSFARYARMHRAALGTGPEHLTASTQLPQPRSLGALDDSRRMLRRRHHHHHRSSASYSSTDTYRRTTQATYATASSYDPNSRPHTLASSSTISSPSAFPPVRWVVTADPDGLADRLVNAVSSFYFALLTDRILCIQPASPSQPGLQAALSTPNIDWTCGGLGPATNTINTDTPAGSGDAAAAAAASASTATSGGRPGPPLSGPDVAFWDPTADDAWLYPEMPVYNTFVRSHLNTVGPANATTIVLRMHRGISVALFHNPHHRRQMEALGLRPDTAFGCAVQFLFGLNAETRALAAADPELHGLMVDEGVVKIGIQIRLGDEKILEQIERKGESPLDDESTAVVEGYLNCAVQLAASVTLLSGPAPAADTAGPAAAGAGGAAVAGERTQMVKNGPAALPPLGPPSPPPPPPTTGPLHRLYFFLMTDTLAVRRLAQERFGAQLLSLSAPSVQFYRNVTPAGLRSTALEHWYFSRCHHHVITAHSGMGRTAAFAGLRPGPSLFSMEVADGGRTGGRGCGLWEADRPLDVYNTWSGV